MENQIEHYFADKEGTYSSLLKRIIEICKEPQNKKALICYSEEKRNLASFVVNLFLKNPYLMKLTEEDLPLEELKKIDEINIIEQIIEKMDLEGIDSLIKATDKNALLTEEFRGSDLISHISKMNYFFLFSEKNHFITSNFPVICEMHNTEDVILPNNIYLPIHPSISLIYNDIIQRNHKNRLRVVSEDIVKKLNCVYLGGSKEQIRFLFARDRKDLKSVVEEHYPSPRERR